jgi:hypothetical protein
MNLGTEEHLFKCEPIRYFIAIALVVVVVDLLIAKRYRTLSGVISRILSILCCAVILNTLCLSFPKVLWGIILLQLMSLFYNVMDWLIYGDRTKTETRVFIVRDEGHGPAF